MIQTKKLGYGLIALTFILCLASCGGSSVETQPCPQEKDILTRLTDSDGTLYTIATDGNVYKHTSNGCAFFQKYFEPDYEVKNYEHHKDSVYIKSSEGLFPTRNTFLDDFEKYATFNDMFILSMKDTNRNWNTITLQSPLAPSLSDYIALRTCIFNGSCTFKDNRIAIISDPLQPTNHAIKFTAVAPTASMVTSKSSMESTIAYFQKGSDLWFEARYLFTAALPYSIADFESQWYEQSPGPRIVCSNGALAVENKFGIKLKFRQSTPIPVPIGTWVRVKLHIHFDEKAGTIELWQDGNKLLDVQNQPTLPLVNAIQTNIEIGISATSNDCVVYMDDVRLSSKPF